MKWEKLVRRDQILDLWIDHNQRNRTHKELADSIYQQIVSTHGHLNAVPVDEKRLAVICQQIYW